MQANKNQHKHTQANQSYVNHHRQVISKEEFQKKTVVAMAHYEYINRLSRTEALRKAQQEVSQKYMITDNQ